VSIKVLTHQCATVSVAMANNLRKLVANQLQIDIADSYRKSKAATITEQLGMNRLLKESAGKIEYLAEFKKMTKQHW